MATSSPNWTGPSPTDGVATEEGAADVEGSGALGQAASTFYSRFALWVCVCLTPSPTPPLR